MTDKQKEKWFEELRKENELLDASIAQCQESYLKNEKLIHDAIKGNPNWREDRKTRALLDSQRNDEKQMRQFRHKKEFNEIILSGKAYASEYLYSDVNPYEVIEFCTPTKWVVRSMKAHLTPEADKALHDSFIPGGFCGHFDNDLQEWEFESDPDGFTLIIRQHSDGLWYRPHTRTCPFRIHKEPYKVHDYNF